ncbi:MAG: helix-turn-helix transcriptional regulator, partial [Planctomycetota bacterium]
VERAMRMIWQQVEDGLTVRDLVDRLPVSPRTLVRRFEKALGRTPHQEIRRSQTSAARRLLITTDMPLGEVAVRSGLGTASNLSQAVRRTFGLSPTRLRRRHR